MDELTEALRRIVREEVARELRAFHSPSAPGANRATTLLNVRQTAERLQVAPDTVYRMIADKELRAIDIGRDDRVRRRIREDDLQAFIDSRPNIG